MVCPISRAALAHIHEVGWLKGAEEHAHREMHSCTLYKD